MKGKNFLTVFVAIVMSVFMALSASAAVPVISAPSSQSVNEGQLLSFTVTATDASGHTMSFSSSNMPAGAALTTTSSAAGTLIGQFNWVPNFNQAGTYSNILVTATDSLGNAVTSVLSITVNDVATPISTTTGMQIMAVELDDDDLSETSTNFVRDVLRGESFDVKVHVKSSSDVKDVQVSASVRGYDRREEIEDISDTFDMKAGVTYVKKLSLDLPDRAEQDRYKLRVQVEDRDSPTVEKTYELEIDTERHALKIKDVVLNPEDEVVAGRAVISTVRVQNMGEKDEKGVKVKVSIPELGVSASDFIDEIEKAGSDDDEATSEELFLRIPSSARPGDYKVVVDLFFRDGDEHVTKSMTLRVIESEAARTVADEGKVTISYSAEKQSVATGGAGTAFPITFSNTGKTAKVYTLDVEASDFGTAKVSPSNVATIRPGETVTAYVFVTANAGTASGERAVVVNIRDTAGNSIKQLSLRADVTGGAQQQPLFGGSRKVLEVGLIALIVVLAIIALVVAFQRLKGGKEEEEGSQTYY